MECEHFLLVKVTSLLQCVMCGDTHFNVTSYQPVVLCAQGEVDAAARVFFFLCLHQNASSENEVI